MTKYYGVFLRNASLSFYALDLAKHVNMMEYITSKVAPCKENRTTNRLNLLPVGIYSAVLGCFCRL